MSTRNTLNHVLTLLITLLPVLNAVAGGGETKAKAGHILTANYLPEQLDKLTNLPSDLHGVSGIIGWDDYLWMHNDAGDNACLYRYNPSDESLDKFCINNAEHIDWEDITQDNENIYIADVGNNDGRREVMTIYIVSKADLKSTTDFSVDAKKIDFIWPEYEPGAYAYKQHDFDCEAVVSIGDSLMLFTKNRKSQQRLDVWMMAKDAGEQEVVKKQMLPGLGQVTGADYDEATGRVALIGYFFGMYTGHGDFTPFIQVFDVDTTNYLRLHTAMSLPKLKNVSIQTEGIYFATSDSLIISCEKSRKKQSLFAVSLKEVEGHSIVLKVDVDNGEISVSSTDKQDRGYYLYKVYGSQMYYESTYTGMKSGKEYQLTQNFKGLQSSYLFIANGDKYWIADLTQFTNEQRPY